MQAEERSRAEVLEDLAAFTAILAERPGCCVTYEPYTKKHGPNFHFDWFTETIQEGDTAFRWDDGGELTIYYPHRADRFVRGTTEWDHIPLGLLRHCRGSCAFGRGEGLAALFFWRSVNGLENDLFDLGQREVL